jgi:arylsulfatase A-like enzyme
MNLFRSRVGTLAVALSFFIANAAVATDAEKNQSATRVSPLRTPPRAAKPNVVFFLADDLRPDGLAALGNKIVKSPNLDAVVSRGCVFRHAYTTGSMVGAVCLPSRTMLLTGQSMFRAKNEASGGPDAFTFPRAMREAGYAAIHAGKWENSPKKITNEFDETYDAGNAAQNADKVIDFIRRNAGAKPLFVYFAPHEPHDPQFATPEFYKMYRATDIPAPVDPRPWHPFDNGEMTVRDEKTLPWPRTREAVCGKLARYYASISYLDAQAGRILDALRAGGQFDNTIFIVAGDNGLSLGEHGLVGKQNLYEFGGMHVPLAFAGPGIAKGETGALAYLMDVFPTICDLAGVPKPARVEGKSLAPVMCGESKGVREFLFTAYGKVQRAVRDDRWKLIRYPLIDKTQLFDLQTDPHELNDLSAKPEHAEKIKTLLAQTKNIQREIGDPVPLSVPNPKPAEWSPERLTAKDIEEQKRETDKSAGPGAKTE